MAMTLVHKKVISGVFAVIMVTGSLLLAPGASAKAVCVTSNPSGSCGPYNYRGITNSNGYNTYVGNNCWADPRCQQKVIAHSPGHWSVSAREPAGNESVKTYPDIQQLFNNWTGHGWNGSGNATDTPVRGLGRLVSVYTESMPARGTIAQAAFDVWMSNNHGHANEIMIWLDNHNRGSGGADKKAAVTIYGQRWTLYQDGGDELIWSLGRPGTFKRQGKGVVHILAMLRWLTSHGFTSPAANVEQIDFGWEICSTGGNSQVFRVSRYIIDAAAR